MLVLGSESAARLKLLHQVGLLPKKSLAPNIDETPLLNEKPRDYVLRIAKEKASSINIDDSGHLITADTIVNLGTKIFHKTNDREIAKKYLRQISGRRHNVFSAVCIKHDGKLFFGIEKTIVKARLISDFEIEDYLLSDEWRNKAGGYAIQGSALKFFPIIIGCYSNILGLPLTLLHKKLRSSGYREDKK